MKHFEWFLLSPPISFKKRGSLKENHSKKARLSVKKKDAPFKKNDFH